MSKIEYKNCCENPWFEVGSTGGKEYIYCLYCGFKCYLAE